MTTDKFKIAKDKIDKEFAYYFAEKKEYQYENIEITAEAIGQNWVLCPECNEAFEVEKEHEIIICQNVACRTQMRNPYAKVDEKNIKDN